MKARALSLSALAALPVLLTACGGATTAATNTDTAGKAALTVTDVAGRTVSFDKTPQRVIFGEQRQAYVSMILNKENPVDKVVAWGSDMERAAPDMYARLAKARPQVTSVPKVGAVASGDLTVEGLLAHRPDVYVMTLDSMRAAEKNGLLAQMDKAGIKYVVTDFRIDPAHNTTTSMTLMGQILGREQQATAFLDYYRKAVDPVLKKAEGATNKSTTFLWRAPAIKACCSTWSTANFGQMIEQVGGTNFAKGILTGDEGDLTAEQVLASQPQTVIATGGAWAKQKLDKKAQTSYLAVGYDTTPEQARASLLALRKQPGFEHLKAFDTGRVHGVYHQFYDAPYNFVAYQAFAKWQQPELFTDLDPERTWREFSDRFMPFPAEGTVVASIR